MTPSRLAPAPLLPHGALGAGDVVSTGLRANAPLERKDSDPARAPGDLAQLQEEAEQARSNLIRLHQALMEAEDLVVSTHAALLLAANEQLVVSTLRAQVDAATSAKELKEVSRLTELDALTELPNRALLLDRFSQAIVHAKRNNAFLALLFLDLDNFKQINDTLGHAVGDQALKLAARCLVSAIREGDTVSRHGGDEFLILLAGVTQPTDAVLVAEKVIAALGAPTRAGNHDLRLTASIGISVYPDDGEDVGTLIDRADAAMYIAKKHRLGKYVFNGQDPSKRSITPAPSSRRSDRTRPT